MKHRTLSNLFGRPTRGAVIVLTAVAGVVVWLFFWPIKWRAPQVSPRPIGSFDGAARAAKAWALETPDGIRPECRTIFLDHGRKTEVALVLLHGMTNCPNQFRNFARDAHARGATVLVPRLPHHGIEDRMTTEGGQLTSEEMIETASRAVDIAQGLGERVVVMGLSISGVTAMWIADQRSDVSMAISIAPFFAPAGVPEPVAVPLARTLLRLPNTHLWWDPVARENLVGSPVSYYRFSTHVVAETILLGGQIFRKSFFKPPVAARTVLVVSESDIAINRSVPLNLMKHWKNRGYADGAVIQFPKDQAIPHDCIDPDERGARTDVVYPVLLDLALKGIIPAQN